MIIEEAIQKIQKELSVLMENREVESHLRIIFEDVLGLGRAELVLKSKELLERTDLDRINDIIKQLKDGRPIAYILNEAIFMGYPMYVDERVLVPRSETEELVMLIAERETSRGVSILDIGTGSGCIPLGLSLVGNFDNIDATEVSKEAIEVAKLNFNKYNLDIKLVLEDILKEIPAKKYDIVVSNPPYVKEEEIEGLDRNVKEFEPLIALTPFDEPLLFYRRMIEIADRILNKGGRFYWEIHEDLGKETIRLFDGLDFFNIELIQDIFGRDRFVTATYSHS